MSSPYTHFLLLEMLYEIFSFGVLITFYIFFYFSLLLNFYAAVSFFLAFCVNKAELVLMVAFIVVDLFASDAAKLS